MSASAVSRMIQRLREHWIPPSEIRAEAWALGARHRGAVAAGALQELKASGLPLRRAVLLRAIIRAQARPAVPR